MNAHSLQHATPASEGRDAVAAPPASKPAGAGGFLYTHLPGALSVLLFAALAAWGYRTEWKFTNPLTGRAKASETKATAERDANVIPGPKELATGPCPLDRTRVRLKSADIASRMGLKTEVVGKRPLRATVTALAELDYDQTRLARLSARVPGSIVRVEKEVGNPVRRGEVVALVDAAEVGRTKSEFLQAIAQLDLRQATLNNLESARGSVPEQKIQEAESAVREARVRLRATRQALVNLGLPVDAEEVRKLPPDQQEKRVRFAGLATEYAQSLGPDASANLIPVVAPFDGVVVERNVVTGEVIDSTKILLVVADLSRVWVLADVHTEDADRVAVGQMMTFESAGHKGERLTGKISWTSTTVDPRTRTLRVRAVVDNPQRHWRAHTFGTSQLYLRDDQAPVTAAPVDALQHDGDCQYVFVQLDDTTFEARSVRLGVRGQVGSRKEQWVEVLSGLEPGARIATTGAFALKAEILKDRLGGDAD